MNKLIGLITQRWKTILFLLILGIALERLGFLKWPWTNQTSAQPTTVVKHDTVDRVTNLAPEFTEPLKKKGVEQGIIGQIVEKKHEIPPTVVHTTTVIHDTLFKPLSGVFSDRWLVYNMKTTDDKLLTVLAANKALNSVSEYKFPVPAWMENRFLEIQTDEASVRLYFSEEKLIQWNGLHATGFASFSPNKLGLDAWADVLVKERVSIGLFVSTRDGFTKGIRIGTK